jgi:branched-chain amino acid transport system substrate-binding protein
MAVAQSLTAVAYFKMLNEKGGINGRKVNLISVDDGYSPPKTVEQVRKLVEQDQVLLIFGQQGTATAMAVQQYLNRKGIPQLLVASGSSKFNQPEKFPWSIGTAASYRGEAIQFGKYIRQKMPNARVGILYQNDDLGRDYLNGVTDGLGDAAKFLVAEESYEISDPSVDSQIIALKGKGVDVVVVAALAKHATQAIRKIGELGWKPQIFLSLASASVGGVMEPAGVQHGTGVITTTAYKDPSDPRWANDPEYIEYAAFLSKYLPQVSKNDQFAVSSYISAQVLAKILMDAGNNLSRENIKKVATSIKDFRPKMAGPDVSFTITPTDYEMFKSLQFMRFNGKSFEPFDAGTK